MAVPEQEDGSRRGVGKKYVVLCCLLAAIGGFLFGYDQGVISVILVMPKFLQQFPQMDAEQTSNSGFWVGLATSMLQLGGVLGSLAQSWLADKFSRLRAMQFGVVIFVVGSVIQTAAHDYANLVVGRLIGGFGIGMLAMVAPVYMGEISPAEIRGSLLVLEEWCIVVGAITAYWTTYGTRFIANDWAFRLPFLIQIFPSLVLGVAVIFLPQSPRWLATKGRDEEALAVLSKLRRLPPADERVLAEYYDVVADAIFHREVLAKTHNVSADRTVDLPVLTELSAYFDLFRANCRKRTAVGVALVFLQQFVGINALIYYAPTIFSSIGLSYNTSLLMAGIMNILQLVGVTASIPLMDRAGRKPLLIFGGAGMFASQLCLAIIVGLYSQTWATHSAQGWVGVGFIFWYMIAFGISWGPVPWSMPAEIFPSSLRAKGTAFSQSSQWFFNFVIGLVTPPMIQDIRYGTYVFFAVFCFLSIIWSWLLCPETKGKTLEQMDELFHDHSGELDEQAKRTLREDLRNGNGTRANAHDRGYVPSHEDKTVNSHMEIV